ncbi:MAG: Sulfhydrogenase II, beta chain [Candidatus Berkelbacteria bacterium Licking1014_96]|uniref:Sulfhydrogenase II, beta chain n=1 Tax=Candidatus Berkelbacteria bacterium Licking1014_96 TaxID=2017149 RepID=A0A554LGV3_9BACT|nr:MAG: Sulfhydrogenase II, beta chain [Candidatus Berkelbacteria bacterium Licking1014_96]
MTIMCKSCKIEAMRKEILKKDIPQLIKTLAARHTLYAPIKKGREFVFARIKNAKKVVLDYSTTILPPTKLFFPPRECLFTYDNVHLVDIHAILELDEIMLNKHPDYYYQKRREKTTIVGITGNDKNDDFHRALGVDIHQGYDLFLEDAGDRFLAKSITKKGDRILSKKWFKPTKIKEQAPAKEFSSAYQHLFELKSAVERTKDSKVWDKYAALCYGCGNCSFVCPLCFCSNVEDKPSLEKNKGIRERHYDACFFKSFTTVHARGDEGFTFEDNHRDRFYHWYHHKFVQMLAEIGKPGCVNCGRCIKYCPAGINFREVLEEVKKELNQLMKTLEHKNTRTK